MAANEPEFRIISKLGEGSFADVFKVRSNRDGKFYAIKRLKKRYRSIDEVNRLPEILYLKQLQGNPNVIELKDLIYDQKNGYVAIVFELMDCNLYEFLKDCPKHLFEEDVSLLLIYQLLLSVSFLHSHNMFHRDIKPENCMVNKDTYLLKLCDFGSTRAVSSSAPYSEYVSTRWYRAPECILTFGSYGPEVDEWAAGCMLFELLTGNPLFPGLHAIDQIYKIHNLLGTPTSDVLAQFKRNPNTQINFQFQKKPAQDLRKFLPNVSDDTMDLLMKLLTYNPVDRISASEALHHPAFDTINRYHDEWQKNVSTTSSMPFSAYYMQTVHGFQFSANQFSNSDRKEAPTKFHPITISTKKQDTPKKQPVHQPQPPTSKPLNKPFNPLARSKYQVIQQPETDNSLKKSQKLQDPIPISQNPQISYKTKIPGFHPNPPTTNNNDAKIMEIRMKAAQRLKEYESKMKPGPTTFKKPLISNFAAGAPTAASQFKPPYKPANVVHYAPPRNPRMTQQVFQMPKPEILKPRLPPQYKLKENKGDQQSHLPGINQ